MRAPLADSFPCLSDATATTGFDAHYFHQGAWLARCIAEARPTRHLDVGSSVMTIGVLSAFVDTLFLDYRPIDVRLPGLETRPGDLLALDLPGGSVPSLSCLHVIEHVGLGRYGDPLDPAGSAKAATELARVLAPGGSLYLSTPVGRERICFNAHRVFAPSTVARMFAGLELAEFSFVDDTGTLRRGEPLDSAAAMDYGCGLFRFVRRA